MKKIIVSAVFATAAFVFVQASDSPISVHHNQSAAISYDTIPGQNKKRDSSWNRKKYPDTTQRH